MANFDVFFDRVRETPSGCIEWSGSKNAKGYGCLYVGGKNKRATHVSWFIAHGVWPTQHILHKCDNPSCVRPSHLFEGTNRDNVDDMLRKNRQRKGAAKPNAKLTDERVMEIRRRGAAGTHTMRQMAAEYGVTEKVLQKVMHGESWTHLPGATKSNYRTPTNPNKKPVRNPRGPRSALPRYDVRGESLTVFEIAQKYGFIRNTIARRVRTGIRGDMLIAPLQEVPRKPYTRRK